MRYAKQIYSKDPSYIEYVKVTDTTFEVYRDKVWMLSTVNYNWNHPLLKIEEIDKDEFEESIFLDNI